MTSDTKTLCTLCGVVDQVTVEAEGRVKATGTMGACVKGVSFFRDRVRGREDAQRLTTPMIRSPYGWEQISWDYAIDMVADTILSDRAEYGRDSLAFYGVGQMTLEALWVTKKFFQGHLGTNNVCSNAEQCLANNAGGHELVFGNEGPFACYDDYLHAQAMFFYGHNPAANHPTVFVRHVRSNTAAIKVVVDPRVSNTVDQLLKDNPDNIHLQINSGGDVLLNLCIARALLDDGGWNQAYVDRHADPQAREEFFRFLRNGPFSLEEALPLLTPASLAQADLRSRIERAISLWRTARVVSTSSVGVNQTTGSSGVASILNLHLLTGNIGEPGRGHVRLAGQSNASAELALGYSGRLLPFRMKVADAEHRACMASAWGLPSWKISDRAGLPVASFATSERLRTLFIFGTNPARNFPNLNQWREKLQDLCIVYVDSYLNPELLEFADIVLPCRSKHETNGIFVNGERRLQYLSAFAEPPTESWGDVRIVCSIAQRIASRLNPFGDHAPASSAEVDALVAQGNLDLMPDLLHRDFDYPVDVSGEPLSPPIWAEIQAASMGHYNQMIDGQGRPIRFEQIRGGEGVQWAGERRYRPTGEGDGALFSGPFAVQRLYARFHIPADDRLLPYSARMADDEYTLITGRGGLGPGSAKLNIALFNSATATGRHHWPQENFIYVSPQDAAAIGLADDDRVELANVRGVLAGRARISAALPQRHLYLSFHPDRKGTAPNVLTHSDRFDPHTWQPLLKDTQVRLRRLAPEASA